MSKSFRSARKGRVLRIRILGDLNTYDKPDLGGVGEKVTQSRKSLLRLLEKRVVVDGLPLPVVQVLGDLPELGPYDPLAEALRGTRLSAAEQAVWDAEHQKRLGGKLEVARVAEGTAKLMFSEAAEKAAKAAKVKAPPAAGGDA